MLGIRFAVLLDDLRHERERRRAIERLALPQAGTLSRRTGDLALHAARNPFVHLEDDLGRARPSGKLLKMPGGSMPVQKEALFRGFRVALGKQHLARLLVTDGQTVLFQRRNGLVHVRLYQKVRGVARTHGQIEPRPCMAALVDIVEVRHDRARGIVPTAPPFPIAKRQFDGRLAPQRVEDVPRLLARDALRHSKHFELFARQRTLVRQHAQAAEHRILQKRDHLPHRRIGHGGRLRLHQIAPPRFDRF